MRFFSMLELESHKPNRRKRVQSQGQKTSCVQVKDEFAWPRKSIKTIIQEKQTLGGSSNLIKPWVGQKNWLKINTIIRENLQK